MCAPRSTKVFTFKQLLTPEHNLWKHWAASGILLQLMTDTAVPSLQISGNYRCIMRLVIHCYTDIEETQEETCNWVHPSKNIAKEDFIVPARRPSPKHEGGLDVLPPLGSPREFFPVPGYSTQELHMKKQISSRGNFCLLECLPYNPILWATCFGNAAQSGHWQRLKGNDSLQRTVESQDTTLNTLLAAFCLATLIITNILVLNGYWTLAKNIRCCFCEEKHNTKGLKLTL